MFQNAGSSVVLFCVGTSKTSQVTKSFGRHVIVDATSKNSFATIVEVMRFFWITFLIYLEGF